VRGGNEKKPDEIEYTHLMEHLIFRGSKNYSVKDVEKIYTKYGIYDQGFTANDFTCYYRIFPKDSFESLTKIMADKLINLNFTEEEYKAETGAVIGEYLGHYQMPTSRLWSKLHETAFTVHPYRDMPEHLEVLKKMPENMDRVMKFYHDYYKPNNCRLVVVGDFDTEQVKEIINTNYGILKPGKVLPEVPQEPPQEKELTGEVKFPGKTSPYIMISYRIPAYDLNNIDIPSINMIKELYFTEASSIYKRLIYEEKLATSIYFPEYYFCKYEALFSTQIKLKKAEDIEKVKEIFFEEIDKIKKNIPDGEKLEEIKEKNRYKRLTNIDSLERISFTFMDYYFLSRDPDGINKYFKQYLRITPEDLKKTLKKYFVEKHRTVITLTEKESKQHE